MTDTGTTHHAAVPAKGCRPSVQGDYHRRVFRTCTVKPPRPADLETRIATLAERAALGLPLYPR